MKPYHRNPRQISKKSFNELKASLEKLGDLGGIVHNLRTDEIIGGNQRENVFGQAQEIVLVETFDKPDKQGTVAHGFVIWNGAKFAYRQVDWDEATSSEANIRANLTGGTWDFDVFANQWHDVPLVEWGMDTDLLQDWGRDYAALSDMLASEEEPMEEGDAGEGDAGEGDALIGKRRQRWSFRRDCGFLCVRSFVTDSKSNEIEILKTWKTNKPQGIIYKIAGEIYDLLIKTFNNMEDYTVTCAPNHKTGFAFEIGEALADMLGVKFEEYFVTEKNESAKRSIFGDRPPVKLTDKPLKNMIWIDDTLTTGITLESCRNLVTCEFLPIVWIYDDAV